LKNLFSLLANKFNAGQVVLMMRGFETKRMLVGKKDETIIQVSKSWKQEYLILMVTGKSMNKK